MLLHYVKIFFITLLTFFLTLFPIFSEEAKAPGEAQSEQKSEEILVPKNPTFNAITFLKDVLDDKYPLRIDFGAEPHRHGSLVFGSVWYDWNYILSSSVRGEYDHYMTFVNNGETVSTSEVRSVSFTPFPVVLFFGNPDIRAKSVFTEVDIGFYLSQSHSNTNGGSYQNYTENGFQLSENNTRYFMVGPAFNIVVKVPIIKYIDSITEFFFVPAYFLSYNSNSQIHDSQHTSSSSVTGFDLSSPYLKYSLCLDFFRYIRIKSQVTYQHINMRQTIYGEDNDVRYSNHKLIVRYGGELLTPSKTRKKSAHLWAGLYYEMTWEKLYLGTSSSNDYTGKWVLCFGT
ncbi:hypothetical protein DYE50_10665 [Treponema ruminis]|uniref:Uncharacterized protein n=1 Tax=Treponema ruminis TaxID=744515 RepID=A0A7W8G980_9SPIR|nr:hypothetical protein [Treponema ruminis]MBB5226064.1 hypothetical protein [Treponema ruminis]QSI03027.1 hypothetical protein DYE50_10665 [Treponema ruminis]